MEQIQRSDLPARDRSEDPPAPIAVTAQTQTAAIDGLLDEIDQVLEDSAESFVRGFVQKGGQ
jgi:ubiquitin-like protein Pup